ncbi:uncharacterized protein APUU_22125S [Aspergillus puulaauensis]|uniref:Rhodopsin domain-containing protein n=1 Tax=Aspergillus puulaauensis TaxID=1220207 RepID=A0A7R7XIR4_9EURO|nr:uncharacterized protein APUU_22125S [Aspergillus puulaauensis]BCS21693.1 hypothetical protein APUU_22125S [Aspergillus puulaauensis]
MGNLPLVGRSLAIFVTAAVMVGLSIIAVLMRCFVRLYVVRAFGWDDGLMVIALALFIALSILCMLGPEAGIGHRMVDFPDLDSLKKSLLLWWLGQMLYLWSSAVAKVAIAWALLRIAVHRFHRVIIWIVIVVVICIGFAFWVILLFDCQPISYFWERLSFLTARGTCMSSDVLLITAYVYSGLTIFCDFSLGILPICFIWNLQMNRRTKGVLAGILSLGAVASIGVVIRMPYLKNYSDVDFLYSTYQIAIWSIIETGLAIIAGSLITLRPLFRWFLDGTSSYRNRSDGKRHSGAKYALSSITPNEPAPAPGFNDPHYWRPDVNANENTMVTSVTASVGRSNEHSSREALTPLSDGIGHERQLSVERTFRLSSGTRDSWFNRNNNYL